MGLQPWPVPLSDDIDVAKEGGGLAYHHCKGSGPRVEVASSHSSITWKIFNILVSASP